MVLQIWFGVGVVCVVWINVLEIEWGVVDIVVVVCVDVVVLFKIEQVGDLYEVWLVFNVYGLLILIWVMIEILKSVLFVVLIVVVIGIGLVGLIVGMNDFCKDLCCRLDYDCMVLVLYLVQIVCVVWVSGLYVFDGVYNYFFDFKGFWVEVEQGYVLGFDGKFLIYFNQVDLVYLYYGLLVDDLEFVVCVVVVFVVFENVGKGVIFFNGDMIECLYLDVVWMLLVMGGDNDVQMVFVKKLQF